MTRYLNILEKYLEGKHITNGVFSFRNRVHAGEMVQEWRESLAVGAYGGESPVMTVPIPCEKTDPLPPAVRVTSEAVINCENKSIKIDAFSEGAVAKIPIVLAELTIQLNVNSLIDLHEPGFNIQTTKKQVKITKCLLLQNTNVLFIKGYVRKNMEYYSDKGRNSYYTGNDLRHCAIDIPFSCTTAVIFNGSQPDAFIPGSSSDFNFVKSRGVLPSSGEEEEQDDWQINQISTAFYNEQPFCELIGSRIIEMDEVQKIKDSFTVIEERMVIYISLKILQYRQVLIPPRFQEYK